MTRDGEPSQPPVFDVAFRDELKQLFRWRRDVRRFRTDPVDGSLIKELISTAALSPSVGNSQPWRFVNVADPNRRAIIRENFERANASALGDFSGERAKLYATLKLDGLDKAPVQLAVFSDTQTPHGYGLGSRTMPETLAYSVVGAIQTMWLAARARGIGLGWVSILNPAELTQILKVPDTWQFIAYLCIGHPEEEHLDPELVRHGWQDRADISEFILNR